MGNDVAGFGAWAAAGILERSLCLPQPAYAHRPRPLLLREGVEQPDQLAAAGGVGGALARCVTAEGGDRLVEPPLLVPAIALVRTKF